MVRPSTYQYNYCIEVNVCTVMYLEGIENETDSIFEVQMNNNTARRGDFSPIEVKTVFLPKQFHLWT